MLLLTAGPAGAQVSYLGSFRVRDGPTPTAFGTPPAVYTCVEACQVSWAATELRCPQATRGAAVYARPDRRSSTSQLVYYRMNKHTQHSGRRPYSLYLTPTALGSVAVATPSVPCI
jgi:hypothetical protein